jgi:5-formyltetrahydrofolate cyclo-ligase
MLSTLQELKGDFINEASLAIQKRVLLMEEFRTAIRVGLYSPAGNEVRTNLLFEEGDRNRKEIYYPMQENESQRLVFCRVTDLKQVEPGLQGVNCQDRARPVLRDENILETLLVTGVTFDLHGGRLGSAEKLFDRCLKGFRGKRIALAYDFQIVSELPSEFRAKRVDWIVTESRMIKC